MTDIKNIHRQAMKQSDLALRARMSGDEQAAQRHFQSAYELESKAADALVDNWGAEPSRSVLFRSAATLARDCGQFADAEKLIHKALAGEPPAQIAGELRDVLSQVTFERHLELRGVRLAQEEVQMAITGKSVGFGMASVDVFVPRVRSIESLLYRTAERRQNLPYRDRGRRAKSLTENTELSISVPRAACFAVTFRVGGIQPSLPGLSPSEEIIDEFLDCLQLYTERKEEQLKVRIKDDAYYRNFVGLAGIVQPDGAKVDMVGFTAVRGEKTKKVAMRQVVTDTPALTAEDVLPQKMKKDTDDADLVTLRGQLLIANATKRSDTQSGEIEIVMSDSKVKVAVPPGMMSDVVKPLWELEVEVTGIRKGKKIHLMQIKEAS